MKNNYHVTPRPDKLWQVKKEGASRATRVTKTQSEAIKIARNLSVNKKTELIIHGRDGRIRDKDSHGKDPYLPRG